MSKVLKIIWRILPTIILVLTSVSILTILPLRNSPFKAFIVTTGSMRPKIPEGSIVFVDRKPSKPLKTNDIITFKKPNNPIDNVTHRIVKIILKSGKPVIITKGDANNSNDVWDLKKDAIWGKVVFSLPYIGYFANFAKTKIGVIILVLIPLGFIAISELFVIFKEVEKFKERRRKKKQKNSSTEILSKTLPLLLIFLNITLLNSFGVFTDRITSTLAVVTTKCWTNPLQPTSLLPNNNTVSNSTDINFSWPATTSNCPIATLEYNFQIFSDSSLTTLVTESGFLSNLSFNYTSIPEGEYWWRVQAKDQYNNTSNSTSHHLIIDRTSPTVPGQIDWTTENPPSGSDYISGSDFDNFKTCNGALNYSPMTNLWSPSTDTNSFTYEREVYSPIGNLIYFHLGMTTNYENGGGAVDGTTYWVRIRAKDIAGNYSAWTSKCAITYDTTSPSIPSLSVTGSFTKAVEEKINNSDFETGDLTNWRSAGDVQVMTTDNGSTPDFTVTPYDGVYMTRIGQASSYVWENRLMGSFDSGAKSLSMRYNFFSRDAGSQDNPGFFIRLNGQEIFSLNTSSVNPGAINDGNARSTDWQEYKYDLSNVTDSKINLAMYAGNTSDTLNNSWVYVDKITTYFVSAPAHAIYDLSGSDNLGGSGISHFEYDIDGSGWLTGNSFGNVAPFSNGGTHTLLYRSIDNAGNSSAISTVRIITDDIAPSTISDLAVTSTSNTANLTWTAPGNDGTSNRASSYDIRYSTSNITDDTTFNSATKVEKVPVPKEPGETENLEIIGLNPSTLYYFAVKTSDEAPNTSLLSNVPSDTTSAGSTINAGDLIINELMWMGSSQGADDQWIELRNMTDHAIDLTNVTFTKYDGTTDILMLTIPSGNIPAHGYFLIANFANTASKLKDSLTVDLVTTDVDLSNANLSIKLFDSTLNMIDEAWDQSAPIEGIYDATPGSEKYYSMERTSVPGNGTDPLNWYTCIDEASKSDFFDNTADERGTPGATNRSENEPYVENPTQSPTQSPMPTIEITPVPEFTETPVQPTPTIFSTPGVESEVTPTIEPTVEPTNQPVSEPTNEPITDPTPTI